jgi:hypothetical protein
MIDTKKYPTLSGLFNTFVRGRIETSHFEFEVFAKTEKEAEALMVKALWKHADQYDLGTSVVERYKVVEEMFNDYSYQEIKIGAVYRDRDKIYP